MNEISPKLQNQIAQFQQLQQQLQTVLSQKMQMEAQLRETENTLEELVNVTDDAPIYKNVGSLLIKANDKESVVKEIEENKETLEIRVKTLNRQEKQMRERYQSLQDQLQKALGSAGAPPGMN
jgi:prefoldin beta subunit